MKRKFTIYYLLCPPMAWLFAICVILSGAEGCSDDNSVNNSTNPREELIFEADSLVADTSFSYYPQINFKKFKITFTAVSDTLSPNGRKITIRIYKTLDPNPMFEWSKIDSVINGEFEIINETNDNIADITFILEYFNWGYLKIKNLKVYRRD